jgi:hypothetical protein
MPIEIPTRSDLLFYDLQHDLDGSTYTLELRWNVRGQAWFMKVLDAEGVNILQGDIKLVANFPLGAYTTGRSPPGVFMLIDTSGNEEEAGETDLGSRHKLLYWTEAEIAG